MKRFDLMGCLGVLDRLGLWIGLLSLRLILGWEYGESGWEKWQGENWFAEIQARFPFPFDLLPMEWSWTLATGLELVGGVALVLGLGTRFFAASLWVLTWIALFSVHWPTDWMNLHELAQGYTFTDHGWGNFKLPVLFLAMLWPLCWLGAGRLSVDAWWYHRQTDPTALRKVAP